MPTTPTLLKHFRLIGRFDETQAILREIESQPELFDADASRQQRIHVQRETRSIPVRVKHRHPGSADQPDRDVLCSRWTPWADRLPVLRRFLEGIAERQGALLGRVRVVSLPAGQRVYPHVDRGNYYRQHERHHLVLRSTDGSVLRSGGEEVRMRDGELWWFDNRQLHEALNEGDHDRLHVIFDLLPQARAYLLATLAHSSEAQQRVTDFGLPPGTHRLHLPGCLPCQVIVPTTLREPVPLVAVHGMTRDVPALVDALAEPAESLGRWVIAPLFTPQAFPKYRLGRCAQFADAALLRTLREIGRRADLSVRHVDLAGFSAGAQFAHRFAMLYPNRLRRLIVSSAGWYTMPDVDRRHAYPVGLAGQDIGARVMHAQLRAFLGLAITVVVGEADCRADDSTRREPVLDAVQGTDRLERARRYAAALAEAGVQMNQRPSVRLHVLPRAGHDFSACARRGLARLMLEAPEATGPETAQPGPALQVAEPDTVRALRQPHRLPQEAQAA